jgi:tRNA threonylcarbamoyladenosine biosynthesis protein TsaB
MLGIDTSMAHSSVCLLTGDGRELAGDRPAPSRLFEAPGHSAELLPEIDRLLTDSGTGWAEVDSIAVGVGPGTFTGLRIGIASARALAQALDVGVRPVSSLAALAAGAERQALVLALIDARRGEVFAGLYRVAGGDHLRAEWPPFVTPPEQLLERIGELGETPLALGDWALESRELLETAGAEVPSDDSGLHAVNATYVCRLGQAADPVPPEQAEPVYLRLPDAEINRRKAG